MLFKAWWSQLMANAVLPKGFHYGHKEQRSERKGNNKRFLCKGLYGFPGAKLARKAVLGQCGLRRV